VVASVAPPPGRLLELGCGAGRTTRPLVGLGYDVTAVDDSAEMLAHVTGATTLLGDAFAVELGPVFDVVVGASHFVDDADPDRRSELFAACARHLAPGGVALVERHDPTWIAAPDSFEGTMGPVRISFDVHAIAPDGELDASLTYRLPGNAWTQRFRCIAATEELVGREVARHGLRLAGVHGDDDTWLELRHA
jgi:SAM-dependent methyltransferase